MISDHPPLRRACICRFKSTNALAKNAAHRLHQQPKKRHPHERQRNPKKSLPISQKKDIKSPLRKVTTMKLRKPSANSIPDTGLFALTLTTALAPATPMPAPEVLSFVSRFGTVEHRATTTEALTCPCCGKSEQAVSRFYVTGRGYLRVSFCTCSRLEVL